MISVVIPTLTPRRRCYFSNKFDARKASGRPRLGRENTSTQKRHFVLVRNRKRVAVFSPEVKFSDFEAMTVLRGQIIVDTLDTCGTVLDEAGRSSILKIGSKTSIEIWTDGEWCVVCWPRPCEASLSMREYKLGACLGQDAQTGGSTAIGS